MPRIPARIPSPSSSLTTIPVIGFRGYRHALAQTRADQSYRPQRWLYCAHSSSALEAAAHKAPTQLKSLRAIRAGGKVEVLHEPLSWYRVSDHQTTASLSPLRVSKAQNLVLLENVHLYSQ